MLRDWMGKIYSLSKCFEGGNVFYEIIFSAELVTAPEVSALLPLGYTGER